MQATIDLWSVEAQADPYPVYARVLEEVPVWRTGEKSWTFSRHADVMALLMDARMSSVRGGMEYMPEEEQERYRPLTDTNHAMMLFLDPPSHTRLRGLVTQAFSARMIEGLRSEIERMVAEMLNEVVAGEPWNVMEVIADPLPARVTAGMLSVPDEDCERIKGWANDYAAWLGSVREDEGVRDAANRAVVEMSAYILEQVAQRRRAAREDLLSGLVHAEEQGDRLSERELVATVFLLLFAGNETTTNLIGNGLLTLLRHPDELTRLRQEPSLIRTAVEELLRYEGPVQFTTRRALKPLEVGGVTVDEGQWVTVLLGAANRDPQQFSDPHRLDITRRPNKHLTFAHGAHFCLGAPLARAQGQIALNAVVRRFPHLQLVHQRADWRDNPALRGLNSLWVV